MSETVPAATIADLHRDLLGLRQDTARQADAMTSGLRDVAASVQALAAEVRSSTEAANRRIAVDEAWVGLWRSVLAHPTIGRVALVAAVLVIVRLLLPVSAEQAIVAWLLKVLGGG